MFIFLLYTHNKNMKKEKIKTFLFLIIPMLILLTMSILLMYHAQFITNIYKDHFLKQSIWIAIGFLILLLGHFFKPTLLFKYSHLLYYISILTLILVLFMGENINGARAWINLKWFLFQPSELMKLSYSLYLSKLITTKRFYTSKQELLFLCHITLLFIIPTILVFLEPDTGSIIFYFFITIAALWNSNLRKRWLISVFTIISILIVLFFYTYLFQRDLLISILGTSIFYRVERILNIGQGMQIKHARIALGSAPLIQLKLTEVGIYIPEAPTDFIFSLSSNVFGLAGNITILLSYLILDFYFLSFVKHEKNKEKKMLTYTFLSIFIPSQIINIGMNLGILPIIGIPLPFLSYGGSSTIILFTYLSIIFSKNNQEIEALIIED